MPNIMDTRPDADDQPITLSRAAVRTAIPFLVLGVLAILAGGAVAAAARPADWDQGSWAAAYLVLPAGLGSFVGGLALGFLPGPSPTGERPEVNAPLLLFTWILGNAGVLVGNLMDQPIVLIVGSLVLLFVLLDSVWVLRRARARGPWFTAYTAGVVLLVVSVPIGLALAAA